MTNTQRRKSIAIAKDVLVQMKNLNIRQGSYVTPHLQLFTDDDLGKSLQNLVDRFKEKNCSVCALGACFISKARLYNKVDVDKDLIGDQPGIEGDILKEDLIKDIGVHNLLLLEICFEENEEFDLRWKDWNLGWDSKKLNKICPMAERIAAARYGRKAHKMGLLDPDANANAKLLKWMMNNIIKNDGRITFNVTKTDQEIAMVHLRDNNG